MCTLALLAGGCSGQPVVEIDGPAVSGATADSCAALLDALPENLAEEDRREVDAGDGSGAAWGDPPLVLTCGVGVPEGFDRFAKCLEVDGVGWFVPPAQEQDLESEVLLTAVGFEPRVSLLVPPELRGGASAAALTELAGPISEKLRLTDACA